MISIHFASLLAVAAAALSADQISFDAQIVPLLTRMGCNAGACHGAAAGRGEFRLSLLGADPAADHMAIARQFQGRRVNRTQPGESLLLRKPTARLEHGGGQLFEYDDPEAQLLRQWIASGARRGPPVRLSSLVVIPQETLLKEPPWEIGIRVLAVLDGASPIDVTGRVTFVPTDPAAVEVVVPQELSEDSRYRIRARRRGQHVVLVRYLDQVVPAEVSVPLNDGPLNDAVVETQTPAPRHFVDQQIQRKLDMLRIPRSPAADESTWLRRVSLDLTGRLPEPQRVSAFLHSADPRKREHFVDQLLHSEAFIDYWTWTFARWLRLRSFPHERQPLATYAAWLREEIAADTGVDEIVRQLLTTDGDSHVTGPANFSRMVPEARSHAEMVGELFAGIRLGCANCHPHPLDRWTQDDYHGFAAIFARLARGRQVGLAARGEVTNPRTNEPAIPRIPGRQALDPHGDHRQEVVAWLLDPSDSHLARAMANRLWQGMFGRGLVEPVDDLRLTNPPTHPELLAELARDFALHGYRIRHTLRGLALSETYATSADVLPGNREDDRFYSHATPRRLEAALLVDAISDVTGICESFPEHGVERAIHVVDAALPAVVLDALGRCARIDGCADSASRSFGVASQLQLMNGEVINRKLQDPAGRLSQMIARGDSVREIVREWILVALSREATAEELNDWEAILRVADAQQQRERLEDFAWSLLNSRAFTAR